MVQSKLNLFSGFALGVAFTWTFKTKINRFVRYVRFARSGWPNAVTSMKMVLVVRPDLRMSAGKVAAQCAHAAVECHRASMVVTPDAVAFWEMQGQPKIVVISPTGGEDMLINIAHVAHKAGIISSIVRDAGHTQVKSGTATVLGLGPDSSELLDSITGDFRLL